MKNVLKIHEMDPNFPTIILEKIKLFLSIEDIAENPEKHQALVDEIKVEAALITNNSPYSEVRAVVDNTDDPTMPSSTIRAWVIGITLSVIIALTNQLFSIRQPAISIYPNVAQLVCYPIGKAAEKFLPDVGFTMFGVRHSLNPGPFNKKEHMLITIMASVSYSLPYTDYIVWTQVLPQFFNQPYARQFAYQIIIALSTNFVGYGLAGLCRKFLVYPAYCVWPASLVTIALNAAFHSPESGSVAGPFKSVFSMSRLKFFYITFAAMFVYFWFPNFLFQALSYFNWMTWINPSSETTSIITGMTNGLGVNPWPTFDWNILLWDGQDPLMVPFFNTLNKFMGMFISMFFIIAVWWSNVWNTAYLPINSNYVFDNTGSRYNVSRAIDDRGLFDPEKYLSYSQAYLGAANILLYMWFFAIYSATLSYAYLYHRHEIAMGFRNFTNSFRRSKRALETDYQDIHNKLMRSYPEVPEWQYLIVLVLAIALGIAGIAGWETYTTPGVVFYGVILCAIGVIPIGIIKAVTGIEVTLNVLAEFIGGSFVAGNALAMNFFKAYGYVTCAQALRFSNDLKLAHYVKIPPKHTFWAQVVATLVSTFVCTGILNFQITGIKDVCTPEQANHFTCPGINTFFTAAVLWGTVGPHKMFGTNGQYTTILIGFPIGLLFPILIYYIQKKFPAKTWLRQIHPVVLFYGALGWAPYNLSYTWPAVPIGWLAMVWAKKRYLAFWSKV